MHNNPWISFLALLQLTRAAGAAHADSALKDFVAKYHCTIVEQFEMIHERGTRAKSRDRFVVLASRDSPQRFVQCILFDFDGHTFCEASSGRSGPALADAQGLYLGTESQAALKDLGFAEPDGRANYTKKLALGLKPDFVSLAHFMLTVMYRVMGLRDGEVMLLTAPIASKGKTMVTPCKPLS